MSQHRIRSVNGIHPQIGKTKKTTTRFLSRYATIQEQITPHGYIQMRPKRPLRTKGNHRVPNPLGNSLLGSVSYSKTKPAIIQHERMTELRFPTLCAMIKAAIKMRTTVIAMALFSVANAIYGQTVHDIFSFQLQSATLVRNNSVGNEWSYTVLVKSGDGYANEERLHLRGNTRLSIDTTQPVRLDVIVVEDENYPDVGRASHDLDLSTLEIGAPTWIEIPVTVREDRGRYSGNTAEWVFTIVIVRE